MKNTLLIIWLCTAVTHLSLAQVSQRRSIHFRNLGNDSINLSFNEEYNLIEDSCAQIIRYGHLIIKQRMFFGAVKDVDKANPDNIILEGNYTNDGLKNGSFISHYLNGNLQSKGDYIQNKLSGKWQLFYPDGKPKLFFIASAEGVKVTDAWDNKGEKIIDNGNGNYFVNLGSLIWVGKLSNSIPEGTWKATPVNDRSNTIVKENFKDGKFKKGTGPAGDYTDASHIIFFNESDLPFINAEKIRISPVPCNGIKRKQIVNAHYADGARMFSEKIKDIVQPYLKTAVLKPYDTELELTGIVSAKGEISGLTYSSPFDEKFAFGLTNELMKLPFLEPALVDGIPTAQKIIFTFKFMSGLYNFRYRFLPLAH